jgi:hypothetical protein
MNKLYTAVGKMEMRGRFASGRHPLVIVNGKEYLLDLQEMMLWSILNWRILDEEEAFALYERKEREVGYRSHRDYYDCLHRLVQRGLVADGYGETAAEALYDLLSGLYITPISENVFLRLFSFVKLTLLSGVPYTVTKKILCKDKRTDNEKKVMKLARQALLSTAEIIKCVELNRYSFRTEEQILDTLYHDDITTSDNLAALTRNLPMCRPILSSVANLYLRKQIIFERL